MWKSPSWPVANLLCMVCANCLILNLKFTQVSKSAFKITGGNFFDCSLHNCWSFKPTEHPSVNISKFTGGKFLGYCLHKCWILKLKEHPSLKVSKFTGGKFCVYRLRNCFNSQAKRPTISKFCADTKRKIATGKPCWCLNWGVPLAWESNTYTDD